MILTGQRFCAALITFALTFASLSGFAQARSGDWGGRTYYEILELNRGATSSEIKAAFRKKAMQYHPDRNPLDPAVEEEFKAVVAAWEVLGNSTRRAAYDLEKASPSTQTPSNSAKAEEPEPTDEDSTRLDVEKNFMKAIDELVRNNEYAHSEDAVDYIVRQIEANFGTELGSFSRVLARNITDLRHGNLLIRAAVKYWYLKYGIEADQRVYQLREVLKMHKLAIQQWMNSSRHIYFKQEYSHKRSQWSHVDILLKQIEDIEKDYHKVSRHSASPSEMKAACKAYLKPI